MKNIIYIILIIFISLFSCAPKWECAICKKKFSFKEQRYYRSEKFSNEFILPVCKKCYYKK